MNLRFSVILTFIFLAMATRLVPHLWNFAPMGAVALFGAAHFEQKRYAFVIPLLAVWLSDLFLNNVIYQEYYPTFTWFGQGIGYLYGAYALIALLGLQLFRKKVNAPLVFGGAIGSSVLFFLISNFGCWVGSAMYSQDLTGLIACYTAGIPFFQGTFLGDLLFSSALFGGFALAQSRFPQLRISIA
ncbi:MAG: hypothetical protein RI894_1600 [Bacteroidota bacterium]|jgi:hypothetical protein